MVVFLRKYLIPLLLFSLALSFGIGTLQRYYKVSDWRAPFKADKAGYSVYLPATFHFHWDGRSLPDDIEKTTGNGFSIYRETGVIQTKYPYGVALLQLPFYLVADIWVNYQGQEPNTGYTHAHQFAIHISGITYGFIGLLISFQLFKRYLRTWKAVVLTVFITFGSSLFYYLFFDASMSHAYSFFALSWTLLIGDSLRKMPSWKGVLQFGLAAGIVLISRHFNVLAVLFIGMWILSSSTFTRWISQKRFLPLVVAFIIMGFLMIPQLVYNHYAFGSLSPDTYQGESFNWLKSRLGYQLWGARNGMILYTPLFAVGLFALMGSAITRLVQQKKIEQEPPVILFAVFLLLFAYINSCWYAAEFGCSYGMRPYTEYASLFAFALIPAINRVQGLRLYIGIGIGVALCIYTAYTTYWWTGCAFFEGYDYNGYFNILRRGL